MRRIVARLPVGAREELDRLRRRLWIEERVSVSRADLVRFFVHFGLLVVASNRPLCQQFPVALLRRVSRPGAKRRRRRSLPGGVTLRRRILEAVYAAPGEVFTPAQLALLLGVTARDSVRNTLLVLHARGRLAKIGPGQYQAMSPALPGEPAPLLPEPEDEEEPVTERIPTVPA